MSTEKATKKPRTKKQAPPIPETEADKIENVFMGYPEPPSATLDEVEKIEEVEEPKVEEQPIKVEVVPTIQKEDTYAYAAKEELTVEQSILKFIESKPIGEIKINDFIKSLYPSPKCGEPPLWQHQSVSKEVRSVLDKISKEQAVEVVNNNHLRLGTFYYPDTASMKTAYHNLNTIPVLVKKVN